MSVVKVVVSVFVVLFGQMVAMYQHSHDSKDIMVGDWRISYVQLEHDLYDVISEDLRTVNCTFRPDGTGEFLGRSFKWGIGSKYVHMDFGDEKMYGRVFGDDLVIDTDIKSEVEGYIGAKSGKAGQRRPNGMNRSRLLKKDYSLRSIIVETELGIFVRIGRQNIAEYLEIV